MNEAVVILDFDSGNLGSILNIHKYLGIPAKISSQAIDVVTAKKFILPGVGSFDFGIKRLKNKSWFNVFEEKVLKEKTPVLGLCLGMQLMCENSEEGVESGLGWIQARCRKFIPDASLKVPHMGWNEVLVEKKNPLLEMGKEQRFYFVHSYFVECDDPENVLCTSTYNHPFVSGFFKGNIFGVQFHPEKSHRFGMNLFKHFSQVSL